MIIKRFSTLLKTQFKLSLRGMDMVIFAVCMPVAAVVLIGMIYGAQPAYEGAGYTFLEQSFGAIATIAICAGGVMGLPLVISDYRQKHILKRYYVTPSSPVLLLAVQLAIYTIYSLIALLLTYAVSAAFFGLRIQGSPGLFMGSFLLVMMSMFSIGMLVGGLAPDAKTAGILASLLYFPMLLFSGATLPYEVMPEIVQKAADFLPLTQGIHLLKTTFLGLPMSGSKLSLIAMAGITIICTATAVRFFRWD